MRTGPARSTTNPAQNGAGRTGCRVARVAGQRPREQQVSAADDTRRVGRMNKHTRNPQLDDTGHHPMYRDLESRRAYPRVNLPMPVQVGLPGGKVAVAHIYNLSPDGIQAGDRPGREVQRRRCGGWLHVPHAGGSRRRRQLL